jgi:hypothetical protein
MVATINDQSAAVSPYRKVLEELFESSCDHRGLRLTRRY